MREFDLNIERVLENWTVAHALDTSAGSVTTHASGRAEVDRICTTV